MSKVYIVFTIVSDDAGESFIMERTYSNVMDAFKHRFTLDFKYNTENFPKKDKTKWENEINKMIPLLKKENVVETGKTFRYLHDEFCKNEKDKTARDLPEYVVYIKKMTVDSDNDEEQQDYGYC